MLGTPTISMWQASNDYVVVTAAAATAATAARATSATFGDVEGLAHGEHALAFFPPEDGILARVRVKQVVQRRGLVFDPQWPFCPHTTLRDDLHRHGRVRIKQFLKSWG